MIDAEATATEEVAETTSFRPVGGIATDWQDGLSPAAERRGQQVQRQEREQNATGTGRSSTRGSCCEMQRRGAGGGTSDAALTAEMGGGRCA